MAKIASTRDKLQERIKELSCLYEISSVIRQYSNTNKDILSKIATVLQKAWRFPEHAIVEIKVGSDHFQTGNIPGNHIFQEAGIFISNEERGFVKIFYSSPEFTKDDFLPEEYKLLEKAADELSTFYEKKFRQEQEEILRRSINRQDRLAILGEITAGIAHELNTPLGNILGFAELISNRTEHEQTKRDIAKIIKASIFSREVVKKLMFFACEMPQRMEVIKVKPVITQALTLLGPNFKKAQVNYKIETDDNEIKAQLDPIQLTQVLFNLLINALYFSPKDSTIVVKIYGDEKDFFIEISDEGPGIKEEDRSRIFEPFFTTKPTGEGSGLGLSVVHGIIKSHKGNIHTFDNTPTGTIFRIQLPLKM